MPYVLAFNRGALVERGARLARYLGLPGHDFDALLGWVLALRTETGIPHTLAEIGVQEAQLPLLARMSVEDPSAGGNPTPWSLAAAETVFARAFSGDLG
jgi:alcohol dehydrogenase